MSLVDEWPQFRKDIPYSNDSKLNTLQTCIPRPTSANDRERLWVVYVHGGAWHTPSESATDVDRAQDILLKSDVIEHISGIASVNYRLSPAPSHATNPSNPADPARNAYHPDHINDVLAAVLHLQETYRFDNRYLLVGHSCGATLALQLAMKRYWSSQYAPSSGREMNVIPPVAILGIEGIYNLPALVQYHSADPFYHNFVGSAFGPNRDVWEAVSPTSSNLVQSWEDGKLVVIAHSHEDELVEWEQADLMLNSLASQGFQDSGVRQAKLLELHGQHDQMWREGTETARAVEWTIHAIRSL